MPQEREKITIERNTAFYRKQYKRALNDLLRAIPLELEGVDEGDFRPSTAIQSALLDVTKAGSSLKSLLEIEE